MSTLDPLVLLDRCPPLKKEDALGVYIWFSAMRSPQALVQGKWKAADTARAYPIVIRRVWTEDLRSSSPERASLLQAAGISRSLPSAASKIDVYRAMDERVQSWFSRWRETVFDPAKLSPSDARSRELAQLVDGLFELVRPAVHEPGLLAAVRRAAMRKGVPEDAAILTSLSETDILTEVILAREQGQIPFFTGRDGVVRVDYRLIADSINRRWRAGNREQSGHDELSALCGTQDTVEQLDDLDLISRLLEHLDDEDRYIVGHLDETNVAIGETLGLSEGAVRKRLKRIRERAERLGK